MSIDTVRRQTYRLRGRLASRLTHAGRSRRRDAEIAALANADRLAQAHDFVKSRLAHDPDNLDLTDWTIAFKAHVGDAAEALSLAVSAARLRMRRLAEAGAALSPPRLSPQRRIFLAGHFYSGSSAVFDFLGDHPGVVKWSPAGEIRLLKGPGGVADLAKRHAEAGALSESDLVDFYLHIVGRCVTGCPEGVYHPREKVNRHSRLLFGQPAARGYLHACLGCFTQLVALSRNAPSTERVEEHFRDWTTRALDAAAADSGADYLLVDQAIPAWRLRLARFTPPSKFIVVHRDPRDNFAEARAIHMQPGRKLLDAEQYAKRYRRRREAVEAARPELVDRHGHDVMTIGFEEFLLRHSEAADRVRRFVGFDPGDRRRGRFDLEASRRNVGKYRDLASAAEIAVISERLPEYLYDLVAEVT
ncbi:MAG: hypothetical protein ACRDXX_20135 [Stackebrandtia sp.]